MFYVYMLWTSLEHFAYSCIWLWYIATKMHPPLYQRLTQLLSSGFKTRLALNTKLFFLYNIFFIIASGSHIRKCVIDIGQSTLVYWLPYSSNTSHYPSQTPCLLWMSYATQKLLLDSCKSAAFHTFLWPSFQV